ncbi:MAG: subclass B3 metallo-beta-lactamase [Caulobacteraceae bacterium]
MFKRRWMSWLTSAALFLCLAIGPSASAAEDGNAPQTPFKIGDGLYYVGASDIASYLIVTRGGLIVIDGGYASTAPQILANIRRLGFDPRQVKILLNTHGHTDHAGGLAALKAATGAKVYSSALDAPLLEDGGRSDFALGAAYRFPPVHVDQILADNEQVNLGGTILTARLTPGHTRGCTTWTFPVRVAGTLRHALVLCSLSILPSYRLTGPSPSYPGIAMDFARSYARLKTLPCEVFLGSHGAFFRLQQKRAALLAGNPSAFVDPAGCQAFLRISESRFRTALQSRASAPRSSTP